MEQVHKFLHYRLACDSTEPMDANKLAETFFNSYDFSWAAYEDTLSFEEKYDLHDEFDLCPKLDVRSAIEFIKDELNSANLERLETWNKEARKLIAEGVFFAAYKGLNGYYFNWRGEREEAAESLGAEIPKSHLWFWPPNEPAGMTYNQRYYYTENRDVRRLALLIASLNSEDTLWKNAAEYFYRRGNYVVLLFLFHTWKIFNFYTQEDCFASMARSAATGKYCEDETEFFPFGYLPFPELEIRSAIEIHFENSNRNLPKEIEFWDRVNLKLIEDGLFLQRHLPAEKTSITWGEKIARAEFLLNYPIPKSHWWFWNERIKQ